MKTVVVTGAGRGLGLSICQNLLDAGYNVVGISRTITDELNALEAKKNKLSIVQFDLSDIYGIDALCRDIIKKTTAEGKPTIYGLVNNAAVGNDGILSTMHSSDIKQVLDVNIYAPILLTKYFGRSIMLSQSSGRIINIGSIMGTTGYSGLSVYGASKSAIEGFSRSLAREVGKRNITVNVIAPGYMETQMTEGLSKSGRLDSIKRRSALNRFALTDDIAQMVVHLMGEGGKNITGTVITIDAGSTA